MKQANFVVGIHAVQALLEHTPAKVKCLHIQRQRRDKRMQQILALADAGNIKVHMQETEELERFFPKGQHQGVVAECWQAVERVWDLQEVYAAIKGPAFFLVLDGVQD